MATKYRSMAWLLCLLFLSVPRLQAQECGTDDDYYHIIPLNMTRETDPLEYMVSIVINNSSAKFPTTFLTGVLVRNDTVLTSAASLPSQESLESISVAIGTLRAGKGKEIIEVKEVIYVKGFQRGAENCFKSQDVAILLLKNQSSKTPIEIISKRDWDSIKDDPQVNLIARGWFADAQHSTSYYPCLGNTTISVGIGCMEYPIKEKLHCTKRPRTSNPIWSEGAPLIYANKEKGTEVLAGIWGYASDSCEKIGHDVVYTPLAPLTRWIKFPPRKSQRKTFSGK